MMGDVADDLDHSRTPKKTDMLKRTRRPQPASYQATLLEASVCLNGSMNPPLFCDSSRVHRLQAVKLDNIASVDGLRRTLW